MGVYYIILLCDDAKFLYCIAALISFRGLSFTRFLEKNFTSLIIRERPIVIIVLDRT